MSNFQWTCLACGETAECNDVRVFKAIDESHTCDKAKVAGEITRLRAEVERLKAALAEYTQSVVQTAEDLHAERQGTRFSALQEAIDAITELRGQLPATGGEAP